MRIAIVSDIHGNLTAFEAVLADLRETAPDLVLHGGDLADAGSGPVEIVDRIRDLGWPGVVGNTDELLATPETFETFAAERPALRSLWAVVREMAKATRERLGEQRLSWLGALPRALTVPPVALVHASPASPWRSPLPEAGDQDLDAVYGPLRQPVAVYGHIHRPFIRGVSRTIVANSGSVGLPHDGDPRAAYLLLDESRPSIRRVAYDIHREIKARTACGIPHPEWVARILATASPQMP